MKIDIPDVVLTEVLYDIVDGIVLSWMERQLKDDYEYTQPDDIEYYKKHKKYARHFIEYLSVPDGRD